jgi:hypothetical protein
MIMMKWFKAAGVRAVKTFAQSMVSILGAAEFGILEADWMTALSCAAMAAVLSLLTSVAGLPEVTEN